MINSILKSVGNTPTVRIETSNNLGVNLYAKLEYFNPMGSIKDRAANYVLNKIVTENIINKKTKIIESSSGNYGVALSAYANLYGLDFTCVIDPLISSVNENLIRLLGAHIVKVDKRDDFGGYLHTRLSKVQDFLKQNENSYWINQYENPLNAEAYETTIGNEICNNFQKLEYAFVAVSSGGTITGVSKCLKKHFPEIKIVAVDVKGSIIFGGQANQRFVPGIGSSRIPPILKHALIDEVQIVSEPQAIYGCRELLQTQHLFVGGSSGAVYAAIKQKFESNKNVDCPNVLAIFADGGNRYSDTIYNDVWCENFMKRVKSL